VSTRLMFQHLNDECALLGFFFSVLVRLIVVLDMDTKKCFFCQIGYYVVNCCYWLIDEYSVNKAPGFYTPN